MLCVASAQQAMKEGEMEKMRMKKRTGVCGLYRHSASRRIVGVLLCAVLCLTGMFIAPMHTSAEEPEGYLAGTYDLEAWEIWPDYHGDRYTLYVEKTMPPGVEGGFHFDIDFNDGECASDFYLQQGYYIEIKGIPAGTTFSIGEDFTGYDTNISNKDASISGFSIRPDGHGCSGTLVGPDATVTFHNYLHETEIALYANKSADAEMDVGQFSFSLYESDIDGSILGPVASATNAAGMSGSLQLGPFTIESYGDSTNPLYFLLKEDPYTGEGEWTIDLTLFLYKVAVDYAGGTWEMSIYYCSSEDGGETWGAWVDYDEEVTTKQPAFVNDYTAPQTPTYPYIIKYYRDSAEESNLIDTEPGVKEFPAGTEFSEADVDDDYPGGWRNLHKPSTGYKDGEVEYIVEYITAEEGKNIVIVVYKPAAQQITDPDPDPGSLTIAKEVENSLWDAGEAFTFTVVFANADADYGDIAENNAAFTSSDGGKTWSGALTKAADNVTFSGIPADTTYSITETKLVNFDIKAIDISGGVPTSSSAAAGTISGSVPAEASITVTYTNEYVAPDDPPSDPPPSSSSTSRSSTPPSSSPPPIVESSLPPVVESSSPPPLPAESQTPPPPYRLPDAPSRDTPPAPASGGELVLDGDGWLELDENGVPLGRWGWDPAAGEWVFEPFPPLSELPQTGKPLLMATALLGMFGFALICAGVTLISVKKRTPLPDAAPAPERRERTTGGLRSGPR